MRKPSFVTDEHLNYLDDLRESGVTNMFGAPSYLEHDFPELTTDQTRQCVSYWMKTFSQRHARPMGKEGICKNF